LEDDQKVLKEGYKFKDPEINKNSKIGKENKVVA
jgi:hypothetical protein